MRNPNRFFEGFCLIFCLVADLSFFSNVLLQKPWLRPLPNLFVSDGLKLRPYPLSLISAKSITTLNLLLSLMLHKDLTFDLMEFKKDWICLDTTLEEEKEFPFWVKDQLEHLISMMSNQRRN
ncbi:uncharacterized protein LOC115979682 [Quercus lobata]|uniref:uncharacterized protein LOC115979682 n=1 Tax=Quercus lobata TaxID=97700 RepID=UPI0012468851|nr:uncharacterized protein LOC115979682 [Quercus lobata]